jgi:hypothetical protein
VGWRRGRLVEERRGAALAGVHGGGGHWCCWTWIGASRALVERRVQQSPAGS